MSITRESVENKLGEVMDPELYISITDLGLIYGIDIKGDDVTIRMTLTTLGCPLFDTIQEEIEMKLSEIGVEPEHVKIDLTFDPPWSLERMTERAKATLGI
jgi:metal-sulfur cluster biosynthetic enzyme